jgi:hypothetical protein
VVQPIDPDDVAARLVELALVLARPPLLQRFWGEIHRSPFGIDRLRRPFSDYLAAEQRLGRVIEEVDIAAAVTVVFGVCAMVAHSGRLNPAADRSRLARDLDAALAVADTGFVT